VPAVSGVSPKSIALVIFGVAVASAAIALGTVFGLRVHKYMSLNDAQREAMLDARFAQVELVPFRTCSDFSSQMRMYPGCCYDYIDLGSRYSSYYGGGPLVMAMGRPEGVLRGSGATADVSVSGSTAPSTAASVDYSTTNVQVVGIDESDIVKNDGAYIYTVGGGQLVIVRAYPSSQRAVLSRTNLRAAEPATSASVFAAQQALLNGDVLLVMSAAQLAHNASGRSFASVVLQTYNVSDRTRPLLVSSSTFEGKLSTARLVNGYAYVIISSMPHLAGGAALVDRFMSPSSSSSSSSSSSTTSPTPSSNSEPTPFEILPLSALDSIAAPGAATSADEMLPIVEACSELSYIPYVQPRSLLTILSVSVGAQAHRPGLVVGVRTIATGSAYREPAVFASFDSLYVASYNSEWLCADGGWESCTFDEATYLMAYTLPGNGSITLRARGGVPGYLLNQWSMDEFEGHLRVAYTRESRDGVLSENRVDVLRADNLQRVGRLGGLGWGERIYAMRFAGKLAYMVTFRQIDPLYTLDLRTPTAPYVIGELKIPGFSDYLHPINDTALLGIGKAGNDNGQIFGVKVALFDVTNPTLPVLAASVELGGPGSSTPVSEDHKALLFDPARSLLVVPVTEMQSWASCDTPPGFHGARVYTLGGSTGFTLRASIEHGANRSHDSAWPANVSANHQYPMHGCLSTPCQSGAVRRSLYIGDELYTLSDDELRATSMTSWARTWMQPLHVREVLARQGTCTLNGSPIEWARVAASGPDIYWCYEGTACLGDQGLRGYECEPGAYRSMELLLNGALSPCGNLSCTPRGAADVEYNQCVVWF